MKVESFDIGEHVYCDLCSKDYIDSTESGGFLFCSWAVCPVCVPSMMDNIIKSREESFIKEKCPADMSFKDWCLKIRSGNNKIVVYS